MKFQLPFEVKERREILLIYKNDRCIARGVVLRKWPKLFLASADTRWRGCSSNVERLLSVREVQGPMPCFSRRESIVVSTSPCGGNIPGSNPSTRNLSPYGITENRSGLFVYMLT